MFNVDDLVMEQRMGEDEEIKERENEKSSLLILLIVCIL